MGLSIRRIERARDFMALAPLWSKLAGESGQLSPFFSHEWFWCCWHGVWPRRRPEILVLEETGSPVAIVPLMRWRERFRGFPVRYLGFLECPHTPLVDILTVSEHDRVIATCLDHLASRLDWDTIRFQKLPVTSPTLKALEELLPGRLPWRCAGRLFYPYLLIDGDWERFCGAKSPGLKETYQNIQARFKRAGDVSLEEHRAVDLRSPLLQEALAVMNYNGQIDHGVAIETMPRTVEFFRELTRRASKHGWLSLWSLKLKNRVIGVEYQLHSNGKAQALWAGVDPAYREFLPMSALNLSILQALFESGRVSEYSLGPGLKDDGAWWATASHETVHLQLYRPDLYSRLLHTLETVAVPWVQRWGERARVFLVQP
jgi:CelD/BcsL family acetyltransferase involved in cellulose biosynthesis